MLTGVFEGVVVRDRQTQSKRERNREPEKQRNRETEKQRNRETEKQRERFFPVSEKYAEE